MANGFGKYDVYAVAGSIYCYKETNVLRNKFGIRDGAKLRQIETDISTARQTELLSRPVTGHFTASHLLSIHRFLLGDVYAFAGHFRREDIAKGDTRFLGHKEIPQKLNQLLSRLCSDKLLSDLTYDEFITKSAYYMAELNYIHPFREGNGRAIRELMRQLFLRNGYRVNWSAVPVDELLQAMVDSVYDINNLKRVIQECLQKN